MTFDKWWSHLGFSHLCTDCDRNAAYEAWNYQQEEINKITHELAQATQDAHNKGVQLERRKRHQMTERRLGKTAREATEDLFLQMYELGSSDPSIEDDVEAKVNRIVERQRNEASN